MSVSAAAILDTLDRSAEAFVFPMLDNGYVYPAAARLSLFRSADDWAVVIETYGFSPRAGELDLCVTTIGSTVHHDRSGFDDDRFREHVALNPNWTSRLFHPVEEMPTLREDDKESISEDAVGFRLRGRWNPMPGADRHDAAGVHPKESDGVRVYEWARVVAHDHRDAVLATVDERVAALPPGLTRLLVLDDWHHPDLAGVQRPSDTDYFVALAACLAMGDAARFVPDGGNTHWSNWPDGGAL